MRNPILIAQSISRQAKDQLRRENINYLDIAGNCFIKNSHGLFIHIEGKRRENTEIQRKHMTYHKNGIKLIYALLLNKELINQSYSKMAQTANIAKSTIGGILADLKEQNHLISIDKGLKKLFDRERLQDKWIEAFNTRLRLSLLRGRFRFLPNTEWKKMNLGQAAFWGGEPAAHLLTSSLSPSEWTIYSDKDKQALLNELHLIPDPMEGNVIVYKTFWGSSKDNISFTQPGLPIVNPLLVYTDLVGSNNPRNFETAKRIYEQELSPYITA
ncbi:MAG: type IV toxin-antitoxin system AbiEi family antitoxin [Bacteroidota bacterium]